MNFELPKYISNPKDSKAIGIVELLFDQIIIYQKAGIPLKKIYFRLIELNFIYVKEEGFYSALRKTKQKRKLIKEDNTVNKNIPIKSIPINNNKEERKQTLRDILEEDIIIERAPRED